MEKITKAFRASAEITDNQIKVIASSVGNIDRGGDVILPGAYSKAVLKDFDANGGILIGHDWDDLPIGFPVSSGMVGDELHSVAQFHSTESGQEARTVAVERAQNGKSVNVSVGFMPNYASVTEHANGQAMLNYLKANDYDLSLFDVKAIKAWSGWCRTIGEVAELCEWSIVLVGMNRRAKTIDVKSFSDVLGHGLTLADDLEAALGAVKRAYDTALLRTEKGKSLPDERIEQLTEIQSQITEILGMKAETPEPENDHEDRIKAAQLRILNRRIRSAV